jgi:tetratricopeptide (TPR) repeat protein
MGLDLGRTCIGTVRAAAVTFAGALLLAACSHVPHERHDSADADAKLAAALAEWDEAKSRGLNTGALREEQSVIVDNDASRLRFEQLALESPRHVPTLLMCAQTSYDAGEIEKAAAYCDRVLDLQPDNNFAGILRAQSALHDGNIPLAREVTKSQISHSPDSCYLHEVLAGIEYYAGDLATSEREIATAERLGSEGWRIAYQRGLIAEKRGNSADARKFYERASQLRPDYGAAKDRLQGLPPLGAK